MRTPTAGLCPEGVQREDRLLNNGVLIRNDFLQTARFSASMYKATQKN